MRDDNKVSFGYSLMQGKRGNMEDFLHAQFKRCANGEVFGFFGVFDGHGGPAAAEFVKRNLFVKLEQQAMFPAQMEDAIIKAFEETDIAYLNHHTPSRDDGCTGVTAIVSGKTLWVAHVGDSRAVLGRGGKAYPLSEDHKPNSETERTRIENDGGVVIWAGTWRVGGVLAVSRAFGDRPLKKYVIATPDVREEPMGGEDEVLILASDGVWDVVSNKDAVDLVRPIKDCKLAAKKLANEAFTRGSNDNISCIVIRFTV